MTDEQFRWAVYAFVMAVMTAGMGLVVVGDYRCRRRVKRKNEAAQRVWREAVEVAKRTGGRPPRPPTTWICR